MCVSCTLDELSLLSLKASAPLSPVPPLAPLHMAPLPVGTRSVLWAVCIHAVHPLPVLPHPVTLSPRLLSHPLSLLSEQCLQSLIRHSLRLFLWPALSVPQGVVVGRVPGAQLAGGSAASAGFLVLRLPGRRRRGSYFPACQPTVAASRRAPSASLSCMGYYFPDSPAGSWSP